MRRGQRVRGVRLVACCGLFSLGCGDDAPSNDDGTTSAGTDTGAAGQCGDNELKPFRDAWQVEADVDFPYLDADGQAQITSLFIGGHIYNDNFVNQGDVIVRFTGPPNRITVELRRFTMTPNATIAQQDFEALRLWAFDQKVTSPAKPPDMDPASNCATGPWHDGCGIRVYYDGLSQLARAGADIRVTLPADYHHDVQIVTDDNDADASYFDRGNVCVENLAGNAQVELENGQVFVTLADDIGPAPSCPGADVEACETWTDAGEPAPWASECPCVQDGNFGLLSIGSMDGAAADITLDVPAGLWTTINAQNQGEGQSVAGDHCVASVEVAEAVPAPTDFPWIAGASTPKPSEASLEGGGYQILAVSSDCGIVAATESPQDFECGAAGTDQPKTKRGDIVVCAGCLGAATCDDLLPN
jgi:hypothetical protein